MSRRKKKALLRRPAATEAEFRRIDNLEAAMLAELRPVELPVEHQFVPGLYIRTIFMPAGTLLTSKIHKTEHPFVITKGRVSVFIPEEGVVHLEAPHRGITKPGTRRVLYIHEDCTWTTYHPNPTNERDLGAIESRIIEPRALPDGRIANEVYQQLLAAEPARLAGGAA